MITTYIYIYICIYSSVFFFENGINLGSVLQCDQHVVDECFHMCEISSSSFTSHIFAVELYSYIYSFMKCYLHFHTFRMEVSLQVTGVPVTTLPRTTHRNAMSSTLGPFTGPTSGSGHGRWPEAERPPNNESVMTCQPCTSNIHQEMLKYLQLRIGKNIISKTIQRWVKLPYRSTGIFP